VTFYTENFRNATGADLSKSSASRATFARAAVFAEFRPRDARAIDYCNFVDRRPKEPPGQLSGTREAPSPSRALPRGLFPNPQTKETSK
jgi:hypothetical protein